MGGLGDLPWLRALEGLEDRFVREEMLYLGWGGLGFNI